MLKIKFIIAALGLIFCFTAAAQKTMLPKSISGNWLQPQTNEWLISFTPKFVIYKSVYWNYKSITQADGIYTIVATANKQQKTFKVKVKDTATIQFAEEDNATQILSKNFNENPNFNHYDTVGFKGPFIVNDSFTLKAWITDYDASKQDKIVSVQYQTIAGYESKNVVAEVDSLGRFAVTFQLLQPTNLFIKLPTSEKPISIVGIPGESLMMAILPPTVDMSILSGITTQKQVDENRNELIKIISARDQVLFMGTSAKLNSEYNLYLPHEIRNGFSWDDRNDTAASFNVYNKKVLDSALQYRKVLDDFIQKYKTSKKFAQLTGQEIKYKAVDRMLQHRYKNADRLDPDKEKKYLSLIKQYDFLQPLGIISPSYLGCLQDFFDILYSSFFRNMTITVRYTPDSIYPVMKRAGEPLTEKEVSFFEKKVTVAYADSLAATDSINAFQEAFNKKHEAFIKTWTDTSMQSQMDAEVKKRLAAFIAIYGSNLFTDAELLRFALQDINTTKLQSASLKDFYDTNIKNKWMNAQWRNSYNDLANKIKRPLSAESHLIVNEKSNAILEKLLTPYKGKVVYIDFWAPWCGPCMDQIKNYSPALEEATKGKDVVYLFLGIDCAEDNWKNTIKAYGIKGEHYHLSADEGALLRNQFQISGIPHYVLIDKNGNVAKASAPRPEEKDQVLNEMEKLLVQ